MRMKTLIAQYLVTKGLIYQPVIAMSDYACVSYQSSVHNQEHKCSSFCYGFFG